MIEKLSAQRLYKIESGQIRRKIREFDMELVQQSYLQSVNARQMLNTINVAVVGPQNSGKSSLIKTLNFALNGNIEVQSEHLENRESMFRLKKNTIKHNRKVQVNGLSKLKQISEGLQISLYEYESADTSVRSPLNGHLVKLSKMERYAKFTEQIIDRELDKNPKESFPRKLYLALSAHGFSGTKTRNSKINFVILCCSMVDKIEKQEAFAMKCLLSDLQDEDIGYVVVGTKLDCLIGGDEMEQEKVAYIDKWKQYIGRQILPTNCSTSRIFCLQNYTSFPIRINIEVINYYALKLLQKILHQLQTINLQQTSLQKQKKIRKLSKIFCFCS